jgi:hypothetical protein
MLHSNILITSNTDIEKRICRHEAINRLLDAGSLSRLGLRGLTIKAALVLAGHNRRHFPFGLIVCPFDEFIAFL